MKYETFLKCVLYFCRAVVVFGCAFLIYMIYLMQQNTMREFAERRVFDYQCIAAGNHLESRFGHGYGCYEGPETKLIKTFK